MMAPNATSSFLHCAIVLCLAIALGAAGCEVDHDQPASAPDVAPPEPISLWDEHEQAGPIAWLDPDDDALHAAIEQARATADDARELWAAADEEARARWAIKWAAPTVDGEIEFVWVIPQHWSPFRIEGVLASEPVAELAAGRAMGETVSFPIEELADWVHLLEGDPRGPREGGFTMDVLEERYGRPG